MPSFGFATSQARGVPEFHQILLGTGVKIRRFLADSHIGMSRFTLRSTVG